MDRGKMKASVAWPVVGFHILSVGSATVAALPQLQPQMQPQDYPKCHKLNGALSLPDVPIGDEACHVDWSMALLLLNRGCVKAKDDKAFLFSSYILPGVRHGD